MLKTLMLVINRIIKSQIKVKVWCRHGMDNLVIFSEIINKSSDECSKFYDVVCSPNFLFH